ncbi:hypothetical protein [Desulfonatronovibrio hydrogenovorans]|uniref:hypothetical protein n=1 Tax=Desulfonatronovibrio hydrogenovorans TaxID=53245 RepID=UPI00048D04B7|nr:hypothetical protein [Desulfonatronovibrio hydrogenovorans]
MPLKAKNMELVKPEEKLKKLSPETLNRDINQDDLDAFSLITCLALSPDQVKRVCTPLEVFPEQKSVLAVHWHPEYVPMDLIRQRIESTFPQKKQELIIPTQHNQLMSYDGRYSGVEVDCYSRGFKRKVQLLLHFKSDKLEQANTLKSMLEHTFEYRSGQLFQLMETITDPKWEDYVQLAVEGTGVSDAVVEFARIQTWKLMTLLKENESPASKEIIKNRLIKDFIDAQRHLYPENFINKVQVFIKSIKKIVKANFNLTYFYRTSEVIEEARGIGAGIIVPHPEQFWPILLCEYDIDGYEVWNPQSQEYTEFLVNVINRQNRARGTGRKRLLLFMGDDTHLSEKIKDSISIEASKYYRDIGVQPAWDDLSIRKSLIIGNFSREKMIEEYKSRLEG